MQCGWWVDREVEQMLTAGEDVLVGSLHETEASWRWS